jgi:pyruvate/2-oxoglutarate dehydrogenase complex dihydrolipoamide acyltransferase (E2) component
MERVVKRPVVVEGDAIAVRSMVNVCLSFDHRALDGYEAGGFLADLRGRLEAYA